MTNRARRGEATDTRISFPPTETVRIDAPTMRRLHEEGLRFRQEIERRSASMFVANPSESSTKMR